MSTTKFLQVQGLAKTYPGAAEPVFDGVNFGIAKGEFVCIIGHSGCGKTTILNVLAGLETASAGAVIMDNREVAGPSLDRGVVFQGHALMPWLTVRRNIAFAVRSKWPGWSAAQVDAQVEKYVAMVGLANAIDKKPAQLSGGMKQRVGIARAFAIQPKMLLLDEPFGALDALTRGTIQDELLKICAETHQTVFMMRVAEIVRNPLPRSRERATLHHEPLFYAVRNHLVDFLVSRSKTLAHGKGPEFPPEVRPGVDPEPEPDTPLPRTVARPALQRVA